MKYLSLGAMLPIYGDYHDGRQVKLEFKSIVGIAKLLEKKGFDSLWIPDHLVNPGAPPSRFLKGDFTSQDIFKLDSFEAWTTLSALSTITREIKLSNLVICNLFRHPALLAKMASTLDIISNGRLILGMGAGWFKQEAVAYGIPWQPYQVRVEMLQESLRVIKALWTDDEVNFMGKYFHLKKAVLEPKPLQKPRPPIWIGGSSDTMMELVAREADGCDINGSPETIEKRIQILRGKCVENGRSPDAVKVSHPCTVILSSNREEALDTARHYTATPMEEYASQNLLGSSADIVEQIIAYSRAGVNRLIIMFPYDIGLIEDFCDNVLPHLR